MKKANFFIKECLPKLMLFAVAVVLIFGVMSGYLITNANAVDEDTAIIAPTMAAGKTWYQGTLPYYYVTTIYFRDSDAPTTYDESWDASAAQDGSITAYLNGRTVYIVGNGSGSIKANPDSSYMFSVKTGIHSTYAYYTKATTTYEDTYVSTNVYAYADLKTISGLSLLDTSEVTNMSCMFVDLNWMGSLDLSYFDTSNVTNMSRMFDGCSSLYSLKLTSFDTSNVTDMSYMFDGCSSLYSLNLTAFNTSNVTDMGYMFRNCSSASSINVSTFDTSKVSNMTYMFYGCSSVYSLNVSGFNTSNVTNMSYMFSGCIDLSSLNVSNFITDKVSNMSYMFHDCRQLRTLDVSKFNTANVTNMGHMFDDCCNVSVLDVSNFDTSQVTNMAYMFYNCASLTSLNVLDFNTSKVTSMDFMFGIDYVNYSYCSFYTLDVSTWDVSKVTSIKGFIAYLPLRSLSLFDTTVLKNMTGMFEYLSGRSTINFTYDDINLDTTYVTNMSYMFAYCQRAALDLTDINTSNVTNMSHMFYGSRSETGTSGRITTLDISTWDVSKVTSFDYFVGHQPLTALSMCDTSMIKNMSYMFACLSANSSIDFSTVNTSSATNMSYMFYDCHKTKLDLTSFDTSNVTNMSHMFFGDESENSSSTVYYNLQSLDISTWDVSKVTNFQYLIGHQPISTLKMFDTSMVTNMAYMFADLGQNSTFSFENLIDTSSAINMSYMFYQCHRTSLDLTTFDTSNVTNMDYMFGCPSETWYSTYSSYSGTTRYYFSKLKTLNISTWDVSKVTSIKYFIEYAPLRTFNCFDASPIANMSYMFAYLDADSTFSFSVVDSSGATNMSRMFYGAMRSSLDLSMLDTSHVTNMVEMFYGHKCTTINVTNWDVSKVTNMTGMFNHTAGGGTTLKNLVGISNWDVSHVTNMSYMFEDNTVLTTLDLSGWDTSSVINMTRMFQYCRELKTVYIGDNWTVDKVTEYSSMFLSCSEIHGAIDYCGGTGKSYANYKTGYLTYIGPYYAVNGESTEWTNESRTITIELLEGGTNTGARYSYDGGVTWTTSASRTYSVDTTTVDIAVKNSAGYIVEYTANVYVDKTLPTVTEVTGEGKSYVSSRTITITAEDNESGLAEYAYSFDEKLTWQESNEYTYYGQNLDVATVYVKDAAGNIASVKVNVYVVYAPTTVSISGAGSYWTKSKTVTVIASNVLGLPDEPYSFDGGLTWQSENKYTFDTTTETATIIVRDLIGEYVSNTVDIYVDSTLPTMTVSGEGTEYVTSRTITVTAEDNESGLATIAYSFDGGSTWQASNSHTYINTVDTATIMVQDAVGNIASQVANIYVDSIAPTVSVSGEGTVYAANRTLTVTASDANSGLDEKAYSFDGGATWQESNIYTFDSTTIIGTIKVRDAAGNITTKKVNVYVDSTEPYATVSGGSTEWSTSRTISVSAYDLNSGLAANAYSFDGGKSWQASNSYIFTDTTSTVTVMVRDVVGNIKSIQTDVYVDTTAPIVTVEGDSTTWAQSRVITVTASDADSGLATTAYSFDGGLTWQNNKAYVFDSTLKTTTVIVKDNLGNKTSLDVNVYVDTIAPEVGITGDSTTWTTERTITLSATDNDSGLERAYSFDGGLTWQNDNSYTFTDNTMVVTAIVRDVAGNTTSNEVNVYVDSVAPSMSVISIETLPLVSKRTITLDAADDYSGLAATAYSFDDGNTWRTNGTFSYTSLEDIMTVKARDTAGNITSITIDASNYIETSCVSDGSITYVFSDGEPIYTETFEAYGHQVVTLPAVEPTCTETGLTEGEYCVLCKEVLVQREIIPAKGHSYEITSEVDPTCTTQGYKIYTCDNCKDFYYDYTSALGHSIITDEAFEPTCTEIGMTEGTHCERCGLVFIEQNVIPALDHDYVLENTVYNCTEGDTATYICSRCNDSYSSTSKPTGHNYTSKISKNPTCEENGIRTYTCEKCGDSFTESIDAIGHNYITQIVYPTCESDGYTLHICLNCGDEYTSDYVPATGHNYTSKVDVKASCESDGVRTYTCITCKESYAETIPATGHTFDNGLIVAPTCTEDGYTIYTCTSCGYEYVTDFVNATGHHYIDEVILPTCIDDGYTKHTCSDCGYSYNSDVVSALGHTEVVIPETPPTCTENGLTEGIVCGVCGEILSDQIVIPAKGHNYSFTFVWSDDHSAAVVELVCNECYERITVDCVVTYENFPEAYTRVYTATAIYDGQTYTDTYTVVGSPLLLIYATSGEMYAEILDDIAITALATGDEVTYKWQYYRPDGTEWLSFTNSPSPEGAYTLLGNTNRDGYKIRCIIEDMYGNTIVTDIITLTVYCDHIFDEGIIVTAATCTEAGERLQICNTCGEAYYEEIPATGHDFDEGVLTAVDEYEEIVYTCRVCGHQENVRNEHHYTSETVAPTCTVGGYTTYTCDHCGHTYVSDYTEATGHIPGAAATNDKDQVCVICGEIITAATGHNYVPVVTAPTCTAGGYTTYTCADCGDTYITDYSEPTGHTIIVDPAVEPTCTEIGYTEGSHCTVCGEVFKRQEIIEPVGHGYEAIFFWLDDYSSATAILVCTNCGETISDISCDVSISSDGEGLIYVATFVYENQTYTDMQQTESDELFIIEQPEDIEASAGTYVTVSIKASGKNLVYKWQYLKPKTTKWLSFTNSTSTDGTYTFLASTSKDGYKLRCFITDEFGNTVTSDEITLTVSK